MFRLQAVVDTALRVVRADLRTERIQVEFVRLSPAATFVDLARWSLPLRCPPRLAGRAGRALAPGDMIQAPRPGALKASPSGLRWLLTATQHDLESARTRRYVVVGGLSPTSPSEPQSAWTGCIGPELTS